MYSFLHPKRLCEKSKDNDNTLQSWYKAKKRVPESKEALLSRPLRELNGDLKRKLIFPRGKTKYFYKSKVMNISKLLLLKSPVAPPYSVENFSWSKCKIGCENEICEHKASQGQMKTVDQSNQWYENLPLFESIERKRLSSTLDYFPNLYIVVSGCKSKKKTNAYFAYKAKIDGLMYNVAGSDHNHAAAILQGHTIHVGMSTKKIGHDKELLKHSIRSGKRGLKLKLDEANNFIIAA